MFVGAHSGWGRLLSCESQTYGDKCKELSQIKCILGLIDKMKSQKVPRPYGIHSRAPKENKYAIMELL